jgi:DNA polymerase-1
MTQEGETIYLVDGSSYIHRAYHAIRHLTNSKGFPTNAIFGFTKMILKLYEEKRPELIAIVFDAKGPTFRHKLYKEYKATRPPMPDDLVVQLPFIKKIVQGLNIKTLEMEGFEADDIIGTLARMGDEKNYKVIMVTGDKDFRQLISPRISMWDTMKDRFTDLNALREEYDLEPRQMIDLMGLSGDSSDNIPGVVGVGEKTAAELIKEYGTLENVYHNIDEIKKQKLKENLEKCREKAFLSKQLVIIDRFVPIDTSIDDLKVGDPNQEALAEIFREMEFRGLWDQFAPDQDTAETDYRLCLTEAEIIALIEQIQDKGLVSVDTETTGPDPHSAELVGISFSLKENSAHYLPLGHIYIGAPEQLGISRALELLQPVLEDVKISKVGQNIKYDALIFKRYGVDLKGIYFDTMIASYVINPGLRQHNLDYLAQHYLNHKMITYQEVVGKGKNAVCFSDVNVETAKDYSCEDADITFRLMSVLQKKLHEDKNQALFHDLEMNLLPVLMDMERVGIKIDMLFFRDMSRRFGEQIRDIQKDVFKEAGMEFNMNSPQQLGYILFEKLQMPVQGKTIKTKNYSTDVKALKKLASSNFKIPQLILRHRTLSKLKSTYLDALVKMVNSDTGRIHTSFNQTVAATGRLSSSNPNLQNIPIRGEEGREIRKGFIAEDDHFLLSADYSQVELRVFAHYSGDPAFIEAFKFGEDIHSRTASEILGVPLTNVTPDMRRVAKAINFGIIYGMGHLKLADELGIDTKMAKQYIGSYYEKYQGVVKYREEIIKSAQINGFVTTLFNRRRYLPEINSDKQRVRAEAERMAINTPIQGTAADLIKKAMIQIHRRLGKEGFKTRMLLQVHDELVFEVPKEEIDIVSHMIKQEMEEVYPLRVPLKVDMAFGKNWDEAH